MQENYQEELKSRLKSVRKSLLLKMAEEVCQDEKKLQDLVEIALSDIPKISYHACWALLYLSQIDPEILRPFIAQFILKLRNTSSGSQLATLLRILYICRYDTEKLSGSIDFLFQLMTIEKHQQFIKNYALQLLYKIGNHLPEFRNEIAEMMKISSEILDKIYLRKKAKIYHRLLIRKSNINHV